MKTIIELIVKGEMSNGIEYEEKYGGDNIQSMTNEEMKEYVEGVYRDWNNSASFEGDKRTLIGIVKATIITREEILF